MAIPIIAAYADEPESMVIGRAIEHAMLTHKSVSVYMILSILTPLLLELYRGENLKESLERAMIKMLPPACTGREMRESYVEQCGPGNIPKHEKWLQHMKTAKESFFPDFVEQMMTLENDEDVGGWGDRPNSRLSTACYCEQTFSIVLYLSYKYRDDPKKALLQNTMMGGVSGMNVQTFPC
jgi:ADP-ribosylglycohydrolase